MKKIMRKTLLVFMFIFVLIGIAKSCVYATDTIQIKRSLRRYINSSGSYTSTKQYSIVKDPTNAPDGHPIFQLLSMNGSTITGSNYFCVNASVSATWMNTATENNAVTYNRKDLATLTDADYINYKLDNFKKNKAQVMWILDHMYTGGTDKASIDAYLARAGIKYGAIPMFPTITSYYFENENDEDGWSEDSWNGYFYLNGGTRTDVVLTKDMIEAVEQAAIWYFTNGTESGFDAYALPADKRFITWFEYTENRAGDKATNDKIKMMIQEQASILYNYLVDSAKKAVTSGYTPNDVGTINIAYTGTTKVQEEGNNYKIGPVKITSTGTVTGLGIELTTGESNTKITSATYIDKSGNATAVAANKEFYIVVPKSSVDTSVKIKVKATSSGTNKSLWIKESATGANAEQPIISVEPVNKEITTELTASPKAEFDLALRKIIIAIDNDAQKVKNENNQLATRTITADTKTIPDTATYKHRKDPIVVQKGSIVTYKLNIYNEGDVDGYASKIVDQLPVGLKSALTGSTITSANGNTYNVQYDTTNNKLIFTISSALPKSIKAFNGSKLESDSLEIKCEVTEDANPDEKTKHYLTNIAYINEAKDSKGTIREQDRKSESKPSVHPDETAAQLNQTDKDNLYHGSTKNNIFSTSDDIYFAGEEDDDDFETVVLLPKEFDLKLIKYISEINGNKTDRKITVDVKNLNKVIDGVKVTTADYNVSKYPLAVDTGDYVTYTLKIYNEGEIPGYANEISEDIPKGLKYIWDKNITIDAEGKIDYSKVTTELTDEDKKAIEYNLNMGWSIKKSDESENATIISTDHLSRETSTSNLIKAFDEKTMKEPHSQEVSVMLKVISTDTKNIIRNEAAITKDSDAEGKDVTDRDSTPEEWKKENSDDNYDDDPNYPKYKEDDEDYDNIKLKRFDIALRKFISATSTDGDFNNKETTTTYDRAPKVDTTKLKSGEAQTAIYNHSKEPIALDIDTYILYTLRVYNEGDRNGYASQITDYLPEYLDFIETSTNTYIKDINSKWEYDSSTRKLTTKSTAPVATHLLNAFNKETDKGKGEGLSSFDTQVICRINKNAISATKLTNIAEITEYKDKDGNKLDKDEDSEPNNVKLPEDRPGYKDDEINAKKDYILGQQDDDDFEKVLVKEEKKFDLALRKFITNISGKDVTSRIPEVSYEDGKIQYKHPKNVLKVVVGDTVTYTIRVYNEGEMAGFAETVTDDMPEFLEYLPTHKTNRTYRWKMYDKDGKETDELSKAVKIVTDYTSKANGETLMKQDGLEKNPNLLKAFDPATKIGKDNPDYVDIKVAFKVKDPGSNKKVIVNKAQISEDADENGKPVDDIDSVPDKWNDGEDDQDYENISVDYFDLALLKYVSQVKVTENGKTTTTDTKNNGSDNDIIPKVEINRKRLKSTVVKFVYTIKITNEGDIEGYATEITDYVPKGLKFYKEDNNGWKEKSEGVITTNLLSNTLLKPGQSATVKVTFRWINGENNLGVKTNIAEISKDKNDKNVPDRDSTPGNKKPGEDDIDDADVLLSISTGMIENTIKYIGITTGILVVLAGGLILIKKYVL